jgi:hypothetical protein
MSHVMTRPDHNSDGGIESEPPRAVDHSSNDCGTTVSDGTKK